jgi:hypothetical protein
VFTTVFVPVRLEPPQHAQEAKAQEASLCKLATRDKAPDSILIFASGFTFMSEPLPIVIEQSVQIAWDYLERAGELDDAVDASQFLRLTIEMMVWRGERRRLLLSNRAIDYDCRREQILTARVNVSGPASLNQPDVSKNTRG